MEEASPVWSRRWGVALLLLVIVVACGKDGPRRKTHLDLSKEYGAQVKTRLMKLYAIAEANQFAFAGEATPNVVVHVDADTLVAESTDLTKESDSPELTSHTYNGGNGQSNDAQRVVRADFVTQYRAAIANGIKTRWPGSTTGAH
jgi:hypothetical protein